MRRMYTILSFSFVVFLAVLCADFLLTGLFVGLPEGQSGWLVIWSVTVAIICFLTVILSVRSGWRVLTLFVILMSFFGMRVCQKNSEFAYHYENVSEYEELFGYAVSYPLSTQQLQDNDFSFFLKVTKVRDGLIFVPVKPFTVQVKCRNVTKNEILCWGNYRVIGRLKINKSVYFMGKNCIGRLNAKNIIRVDRYLHPMLTVGKIRAKILNHLKNRLSPQSFAFVSAIFFGDRSHIEPEMMKSWRDTGLTHLLAVSGFHVGVLAMLVQCCLRRFFSRTVSSFFTLIVLIIFGLFLNTSASSSRAILMYFILMINGEMGVNCGKLHSLSVAGIILLFINPYTIYDYGFILSFVAVAGILLFASKIVPEKDSFASFFYKALSAVGVCIAAFLSTALFQCAWFGQLPLFSIITSPIVCFIFSCVFVLLLACMLLAFLFPNVIVFNVITDFFSLGFIEIVRILENVPPLKVGEVPLYIGFTLLLSAFSCFYIISPVYSYVRRKIAFNKLKNS